MFFISSDDVMQGSGNEKILLLEPEFLSGFGLVTGIKHLGNSFAKDLGFDGANVIALVEMFQVEFPTGLGGPKPHVGDIIVAVAGNKNVAGHGHYDFSVHPTISNPPFRVGIGFGPAVEPDLLKMRPALDFPRVSAPPPVVALLALVTIV